MGSVFSKPSAPTAPAPAPVAVAPTAVDVSAEGMKKKNLARGTGVTYSGVRTSSRGLLSDVKLEKKTLLGS